VPLSRNPVAAELEGRAPFLDVPPVQISKLKKPFCSHQLKG